MDQTTRPEEAEALEAARNERQRLLARVEPESPARDEHPSYNDALDPISPNFDLRSWV